MEVEATQLYSTAFRMILNLKAGLPVQWNDIFDIFAKLHSLLICAVCRKLCIIPYKRHTANCSHNVCEDCMGDQMRTPCSWCNLEKNFDVNVHLRILLQSYKNMCKFIWSSETISKSELFSVPVFEWISKISEGAIYEDNFRYHGTRKFLRKHFGFLTKPNQRRPPHTHPLYHLKLGYKKDYPKVLLKKLRDPKKVNRKMSSTRRRCRCGFSQVLPQEVSCSGKYCPCFLAGNACINCRCIGCRNPLEYRRRSTIPAIKSMSVEPEIQHEMIIPPVERPFSSLPTDELFPIDIARKTL